MDERLFQGMEYVYEVYRQGSFLAAAQKLFISQPSVSASVRRVEERIGSQIFDRSVKPLALTECGEHYIAAVEEIMTIERDFSEYLNDSAGLRRGHLVLGGSSLFSGLVLPPLMAGFSRRYPQIGQSLVEETSARLGELLVQGRVDLVADFRIPNPECDSCLLEEDALLLAVPAGLAVNEGLKKYRLPQSLAGRSDPGRIPPVPLEAFSEVPFILQKPENDSRQRADNMLREAGVQPKVVMEFDQQMTSYLVASSGMGAGFVSTMLVSRLRPNPELAFYRLGGPFSRRQARLIWKRGRYRTRAMEAFLAFAAEAKKEPAPAFPEADRGRN